MKFQDYIYLKWYVRENDLIGGHCIMPVNQPPSVGIPEIADFTSKEHAEHIVELHNTWLEGVNNERRPNPRY